MQELYEKLGLFYLGKNIENGALTLLKSKNLTTHAAIIGMTGSGKTGLGIGLIEEAAIDNIPVIIIDPKGDMGNLCLTFPQLSPTDFKPWIDPIDASNKGKSLEEAATDTAALWKNGLAAQHQDPARIQKLRDVDTTIYTPGSSAGVGINVLGSFDAPGEEILDDPDTFGALINTTVSSLLALISIKSDALRSKEFLLLSQIFNHFWQRGEGLSLEALIGQIASPPFDKIGVLNLSDFYPQKERFDLAMLFNNVFSSVTFSSWIKGEPLDIQNLLYDENAKAKISIFSIAHLSDDQRMFFVTLLLNRFVGWMRTQRGSSTLRALLYMDEIYGYFPPSKNPPSKAPMMLLLKQARAFGVGVVLSTQNPVDLDYKGLSNIGTWFIGKLQTPQDISKVIDGLAGKIKNMDKAEIIQRISGLKKRTFFLKSAHKDKAELFQTRWVLSYLKGPLSKQDIRTLMADKKNQKHKKTSPYAPKKAPKRSLIKAILSDTIAQYYHDTDIGSDTPFKPFIAVNTEVRFFNQKRGIDKYEKMILKLPLDKDDTQIDWTRAEISKEHYLHYAQHAASSAAFAVLPNFIVKAKSLKTVERSLNNYLYQHKKIELFRCNRLKIESSTDETVRNFSIIRNQTLREKKEEALEKLAKKFDKKIAILQKRRQRAAARLDKEESDVTAKTTDTAISVGMSIFDALFGSKRSAISKGSRALRGGKSVMKERADVIRAEEALQHIENGMHNLEAQFQNESFQLDETFHPDLYPIDSFFIKPRRSDITISHIALLWER
ncbi:MAG: hypothetical protein DRG24_02210 [Epsilonproteobacteria bacterium]|nr:MAG: hypothetical protein DRG24_02210 [Campylobacterota bacterium]